MAIDFPDSPTENQQYTVGDRTWTWNGTYWELSTSTSTFTASDTEPVDPDPGDIWFDSTIGKTFVNYNGTWVEIGNAATVVDVIADADADTKVQVEVTADSDKIEFTTAGTKRLEIDASGHVIPAANETYDLGSASNRFRDLYLSGSSIDLGGVSITSDGSNISLPSVDDIAASSVTIGGENVTPYTGRKNAVINGDMRISQRGTTFNSVATGSYTLDRWVIDHAGGGTAVNITQESFLLGQTDVVGAKNYIRMNVVTSGDFAHLDHRIEDVTLFDNRTVTLSFWAKASSSMNLGFEWLQYFGPGGSAEVTDSNLGFPLTTAWQKFTYTINLPSLSGKVVTSGSSFRLRFVPTSTDAVFASRWGANGNFTGTVDLALVQVESGDKATPFEHRSYGEELALCQRYYHQGGATTVSGMIGADNFANVSTVFFPTAMRATPSVTVYKGGVAGRMYATWGSGGFGDLTGWTPGSLHNYGFAQYRNFGSGAGAAVRAFMDYYVASAEL